MFQLQASKSIKWPVNVNIPRDGGKTVKATFTGHFSLISQDEFDAVYNDGGNDETLVRAVLTGWGNDVNDADGNAMAFNDENLNKMAGVPYVRAAIVAAYIEVSHGKVATKN